MIYLLLKFGLYWFLFASLHCNNKNKYVMKKQSVVYPYTCAALIDEFYTCFNEVFKDEETSFFAGKSKCLNLGDLRKISFDVFSKFVQDLAREYKVDEVLYPNGFSSSFYYNINLSPICEFYDAKSFRRIGFFRGMEILSEYPAILHVFVSTLRKCGLNCYFVLSNFPCIIVGDFVFKYKY